MDTKYFQQALDEWRHSRLQPAPADMKVGQMTLGQLSWLLRRAQELKDADQAKSAVLDRMGA